MADTEPQPLVDFSTLPGRVRSVALPLGALALVACIADGALNGLTFALMGRWVGVYAVVTVLAAAIVTAVHALRGADAAAKRGERLSAHDVGITPRRLSAVPADDARPPAAGAAESATTDDR